MKKDEHSPTARTDLQHGASARSASHAPRRFSFAEFDQASSAGQELATGDSITLVLVERGRATICSDDVRHELHDRQCGVYISSRSTEMYDLGGDAQSVFSCSVNRAAFPRFRDFERIASTSHILTTDRLPTLFRLGINVEDSNSSSGLNFRDTIGEALLCAFVVESGVNPAGQVPAFIQKARAYIDENFCGACELGRVAALVGVSKEHLVSEFRRYLGITPIRYLWDLRTREAAHLVRTTPMTLVKIATLTGYKSEFHLSREIKRVMGLSPRELRRDR